MQEDGSFGLNGMIEQALLPEMLMVRDRTTNLPIVTINDPEPNLLTLISWTGLTVPADDTAVLSFYQIMCMIGYRVTASLKYIKYIKKLANGRPEVYIEADAVHEGILDVSYGERSYKAPIAHPLVLKLLSARVVNQRHCVEAAVNQFIEVADELLLTYPIQTTRHRLLKEAKKAKEAVSSTPT